MAIHPLSYFTGADGVKPFDGELAYDDDTFDIYIFNEKDDGTWTPKSRTREIQEYLDDLKRSGVFTAASAFVNNRKIYRFFFDQLNGVVRLDPELRFDPLYRYYAIRKTTLDEHGAYVYITGVTGENGEGNTVVSSLVDMVEEDAESGDGTKVMKPEVGGLADVVTNGEIYVVEFYNASRELMNQQNYQAIAVRTADLDLAPDTAVTDMYIQTNQSYSGDDNAVYLYRGQDVGELEIETRLKYADGRTRSVSHEQTVGGRLTILGLDDLNTDTVTAEGEDPQTFEIVYQLVRTNASMGTSTSQSETGATISPASLTISKTIKVYIIEDIYNELVKIIPAGYISDAATGNPKIVIKFFGHYSNGSVNDITNITQYADDKVLINNSFGVTQNLKVSVPYGNAGLTKTLSFSITVPTYDQASQNPVAISNEAPRFVTFDNTATSGGLYSGKFTSFEVYNNATGNYETLDYQAMLARDDVRLGSHVPTHIRVRDVIDPKYTFTDIVDASSGAYFSTIGSGHEISKDRALLIEFFELTMDEGGRAVSAFTTGALVFYAKKKV
jgi:hypothetical protein